MDHLTLPGMELREDGKPKRIPVKSKGKVAPAAAAPPKLFSPLNASGKASLSVGSTPSPGDATFSSLEELKAKDRQERKDRRAAEDKAWKDSGEIEELDIDSSLTPVKTCESIEVKIIDSQASEEEANDSSSGSDSETNRKLEKRNTQAVSTKSQLAKKNEFSLDSSSDSDSDKKPAAKPAAKSMAGGNLPKKLFNNDDPEPNSPEEPNSAEESVNVDDAEALLRSIGNIGENNNLSTILEESESPPVPAIGLKPNEPEMIDLKNDGSSSGDSQP